MLLIEGKGINSTWETSIRMLLSQAEQYVPAPSGMLTARQLNLCMSVQDIRRPSQLSEYCIWPMDYVEEYSRILTVGGQGEHVLRDRMLREVDRGVSQLEWARNELSRTPPSRRAVVSFWDSPVDCSSHRPPGLVCCHFIRSSQTLNLTLYFRSNDAWNSALPDMFAFCDLLRHESDILGLRPGTYSHFVGDYHIYYHDLAYIIARMNCEG